MKASRIIASAGDFAANPRLAKGRTRVTPMVSFQTAPADYREGSDWFDVPNEGWTQGNMTGVKAAWEALADARSDPLDAAERLALSMRAACKLLAQHSGEAPSRCGAAVSFIEAISRAVCDQAAAGDFEPMLTTMLRQAEDSLSLELQQVKTQNNGFIRAMAAPAVAEQRRA